MKIVAEVLLPILSIKITTVISVFPLVFSSEGLAYFYLPATIQILHLSPIPLHQQELPAQ